MQTAIIKTIHSKAIKAILLTLLWLAATMLPKAAVRAQSGESAWVQAVSIANAPSTTEPVVVAGPQGKVQAFWWDESQGLTTVVYDGSQWLPPEASQIAPLSEQAEGAGYAARVGEMPAIIDDGLGWAHAFWLGAEDARKGARPLLHSRLAVGTSNWDRPKQVTDAATAWSVAATTGGALYLIYFCPTDTANRPAGVYHQRSFDGGLNWTPPVALSTSPDFRNTREAAGLQIAVSAKGDVYATWDDPQTNQAMLTSSDDGGRNWQEPQPVGTSDLNARRAQIIPGRENELLLLWEASRSGLATGIYQQRSLNSGQTWSDPEQVMDSWAMSMQGITLLPLPNGQVWMLAGSQPGTLDLFIWDGEQASDSETVGWPKVQSIELRATDTADGPADDSIQVSAWRAVLQGETLTLVGRDANNRVWAVRLPVQGVQEAYLPTSGEPESATSVPSAASLPSVATPVAPVTEWGEPTNLSRSGSASQPVLVAGQGATCQVFWWDQFDGLMSAYYNGQSWSPATASPILVTKAVERVSEQLETVRGPLAQMPQIVSDGRGRAHAFWLMVLPSDPGSIQDEQSVQYALMHSALSLGQSAWSEPRAVAESALVWRTFTDPSGRLHLLYVRPTHTNGAPAGVYYASLAAGAVDWSARQALYPSIYARLLLAEQVHLTGAADGEEHVVAAWNDPRLERTFMANSADGGVTWERPSDVTVPDVTLPQLVAVGNGAFLALWQGARAGYGTALYEQHSSDGGRTWDTPRRVLDDLSASTQEVALRYAGQGNALLVVGAGSPGLTLAAWDASQKTRPDIMGWSELHRLEMSFRDAETGRTVWLGALQLDIIEGQMLLVGQGQDGEVWALQREATGLDWIFAPPPPWSEPTLISSGQENPGLPSIAADVEGHVHVLWGGAVDVPLTSSGGVVLAQGATGGRTLTYTRWDGTRWIPPAQVLSSPDGRAEQPCLVAAGEYLHAVWSGGANGQIYYSSAFLRDGSTAGGWSEPVALPGPERGQSVGSAPHLVADLGGNLHLVYAVPLNEGRGIYYLRSDDGGVSWSPLHTVLDAEAAGWARVDRPTVAVDVDGALYVACVRATLDGSMTEGVYFASSYDAGETWSSAFLISEEGGDYPQVAVASQGNVHLIWYDATGSGAWSGRWSVDGGRSWAPPIRVRGFTAIWGRPALVSDLAGGLHLLGVGPDDVGQPVLLHTTWSNESHQWETLERYSLGQTAAGGMADRADVVTAMLASRGQLHVVLRGGAAPDGRATDGDTVGQMGLFHTQRAIPAVEQMPVLMVTPAPTVSPTPSTEGTPAPQPTPTINPAPPPSAQAVELGPLSLPLMGIGGILVVIMLLGGILVLRSLSKQGGKYYRRRN
ncbi:MAG: hypothetical protein GX552_00450 [Chloroflexi bacterium]|nr:hypothetical protein [Chloroflexota bacterium]